MIGNIMSELLRAAAVVIVALAILHVVSVEMRLADITRRLEDAERSLDRLRKVWWEGVARRNGFTVKQGADDESAGQA